MNVNHVKAAISTSIDESTKHIIEVTNNTTTNMLEKVSPEEVDAFQAYTIRNLENNLATSSDIEQYRLLSVTEDPKQEHLYVMSFPVLIPTDQLHMYSMVRLISDFQISYP